MAGKHHHPAIQSQGDSSVGWGTVAESLEQETETHLSFFRIDAQEIKDLLLDEGVVDPDAAAARFVAVADQVVGLCPHGARIAGQGLEILLDRESELVMLGIPTLLILVPAQQGEIDNPGDLQFAGIVEFQFHAEPVPQRGQGR